MADRVRLGFIGAGWWATSNHMPVLANHDAVDLVGVCRLGSDELAELKERYGFSYTTENFRDLLANCELDCVVVASPHTLHHEHAKAALDLGLHVMCEKPMTTRADHARELVQIAETNSRHLLVPYGWHYKSFTQRAKALMDDGAVGEIEYVLCHMASPIRELLSGGDFDTGADSGSSEGVSFAPDSATWADPQRAGGGYGHAQISHSSGMLFWLTGLRASSVFSVMSGPGAKVELYDAMTVRFTNGAIGTVSGAGNVPAGQGFQVDVRIFGKEGVLLIDCDRERMELQRHDGKHKKLDLEPGSGDYECSGPPENFVELVAGRTEVNWAPGEVAMRGVEVLDAAYRSAVSGVEEKV
ncbi:MAG: Gfo/Idh/MocA family oxidoreductase [Candidatus Latescibacterota bacterium]|nr:Gfo/Idh/MocA family oxidoreductase [Candidatus Latescibacterota bacterium]